MMVAIWLSGWKASCDTCILQIFPAPLPSSSSFLLVQNLGGSSDDLDDWISATHMEDLDCVLGSHILP